jgi:hypothetical protein
VRAYVAHLLVAVDHIYRRSLSLILDVMSSVGSRADIYVLPTELSDP